MAETLSRIEIVNAVLLLKQLTANRAIEENISIGYSGADLFTQGMFFAVDQWLDNEHSYLDREDIDKEEADSALLTVFFALVRALEQTTTKPERTSLPEWKQINYIAGQAQAKMLLEGIRMYNRLNHVM